MVTVFTCAKNHLPLVKLERCKKEVQIAGYHVFIKFTQN